MESTRTSHKNPAPTVAGLPVEMPTHAPDELVTFSVKVRRSQNGVAMASQLGAVNGNGTYLPEDEA